MYDDNNYDYLPEDDMDSTDSAELADDTDIFAAEETDDVDLWSVEEYIDINDDGTDDVHVTGYDTNEDYEVDTVFTEADLNSDGTIDTVSYIEDVDYDGEADLFVTEADTNFDGNVDFSDTRYIVQNEDGSSTEYYSTVADTDYDGEIDSANFGFTTTPADDTTDTDYVPAEPEYDLNVTEPEPVYAPEPEPAYAPEPEPVYAPEPEPVYAPEPEPTYAPPVDVEPVYTSNPEPETTVLYSAPSYSEPEFETLEVNNDTSPDYEEDGIKYIDTDNDGTIDTVMEGIDSDGDGIEDLLLTSVDLDGDGDIDTVTYSKDFDGDGKADFVISRTDLDGDGDFDSFEAKLVSYDEEGGSNEFFFKAEDLDGDGIIDNFDTGTKEYSADETIERDHFALFNNSDVEPIDTDPVDSDEAEVEETDEMVAPTEEESNDEPVLVFEDAEEADADKPENDVIYYEESEEEIVYNPENVDDEDTLVLPVVSFDTNADNGRSYTELLNFDPADADEDGIIGEPEDSLEYWEYQGNTYRCAIYSQKFAIEELTGQELDIEELAALAEENGWYAEEWGGTPSQHSTKILEYYGIEFTDGYDNTLDDLAESLNNGNRVIAWVDADEYWYGENDGETNMYTPGDGINHAVEVVGIDNSDPDNPMIILNDSGHPEGQGLMVPAETFLDAWEDGNNYMIEC